MIFMLLRESCQEQSHDENVPVEYNLILNPYQIATQPEQLDEGSSTSVLSLVLRSTPRRMTTTNPSPRRQVAI
ncbi:hypothetical protein PGT21_017178 [Puccinia graminis f. sp. tritici]|uniref:Uncharacterized protein n=1 Tax=Puccinia graminis f. sp. tritici TaxID=56615 RepID=A0A5B0RYF9_PUCGR|nr:hypothetical protein PGT21_017178 [Puccinia graminis f. sp. tritici]KAA1130492.1 hypothetical protein PGTUg99_008485 [Puccinia graminis f. sp. tritici]